MLHEQTSVTQGELSQPGTVSGGMQDVSASPGPERSEERRAITLAEAVQICDDIARRAELRRQEILEREARIAMELELPG